MLDTSRHFRDIDFLYKTIDVMALHKLNWFHLHFSDDDAYRLESTIYPKLNSVGSRGNRSFWWEVDGGEKTLFRPLSLEAPFDDLPDPKFYQKADIASLVNYANERFIEVIPEFDIPGHSAAWLRAYPEHRLSYVDEESGEVKTSKRVLDVTSPETEAFVKSLLGEIHEAFQKPQWIHLGADEVNLYGFRLSHDDQTTFLRRIEQHVRDAFGAEPIIWNDFQKAHTDGGLASGLVQHWAYVVEDNEAQVYFENQNLRHIISLAQNYYIDTKQYPADAGHFFGVLMGLGFQLPGYPTSNDAAKMNLETLNLTGMDTFDIEKHPLFLSSRTIYEAADDMLILERSGVEVEVARENTIGIEGALWSEFVTTDDKAWEKMLPRLSVIAERAWRDPRSENPSAWPEDWEAFSLRMEKFLYPRFEAMGISAYYD